MLDTASRQRIILHQEGAILANVGNCGAETACDVARCQIDGIANALIRMEGAKETATFVFALSDRVAGGMREETDYLPQFLGGEADFDDDPPPAPPTKASNRLPDFAYGFLCGLGAMIAFTMLAMGRV